MIKLNNGVWLSFVICVMAFAIFVVLLDIALWITWFLRFIEVRSLFDNWLVGVNGWLILLLAVGCSLLISLISRLFKIPAGAGGT